MYVYMYTYMYTNITCPSSVVGGPLLNSANSSPSPPLPSYPPPATLCCDSMGEGASCCIYTLDGVDATDATDAATDDAPDAATDDAADGTHAADGAFLQRRCCRMASWYCSSQLRQ